MLNTEKKGRKLRKAVIGLAVLVAVLGAAIGVFQFKSPLEAVLTPEKVENLSAEACYSQISLKWDKVSHAKGYEVLEKDMLSGDSYESIGKTSGENHFTIENYDRDSRHEYCVVAYGKDPFNGKEYDGEMSDPVEAYYDMDSFAQKIPVLAYHAVSAGSEKPTTGLCVSEVDFEEQMKYLSDNGFTTVTMDEFRQWHAGKKEFPPKSCLITFDDGLDSVYYLAYPILKKYDQAATLFVIGHRIGDKTDPFDPDSEESHYVGRDVIDKVRAEYPRFEFESHTYNMHKRINGRKPVNVLNYDEMVADSKKNASFGFTYMAYPWGAYNESMQKALEDTGYEMAFAYRPYRYTTRDDDPYAISRIKVNGTKSIDKFIAIVNGDRKDDQ